MSLFDKKVLLLQYKNDTILPNERHIMFLKCRDTLLTGTSHYLRWNYLTVSLQGHYSMYIITFIVFLLGLNFIIMFQTL